MNYANVVKLPQFFRNLHRVSEILTILIRHGFGDLVTRINNAYGKPLKVVKPSFGEQQSQYDMATRLRLVFEELGPTFIKLGQLIATRPDAFPPNIVLEFKKLQDKVSPFPTSQAIRILEDEFKNPRTALFEAFDETPLAAGSIAQVYRAKTAAGEDVVVKIQRPGIERTMEVDLEIVRGLVSLIEEALPEVATYNLPIIIDEFEQILRMECDFNKEAQNMNLFAEQHKDKELLVVPRTYPELSSKRVLTQEFIDGTKANESCDFPADVKLNLVKTLTSVLLDSVFEHRFFHADPHAGNIILTKDQKIALIDFGEMGRVDKQRLRFILDFLTATLAKNPERMLRLLQDNRMAPSRLDEAAVRVQIAAILDSYLDKDLQGVNMVKMLSEVFEVVRRYGIRPPADILMIAKSLTMLESVAASLAPNFKPVETIKPYVFRHYVRHYINPKTRLDNAYEIIESYKKLLIELPKESRAILYNLSTGNFTVKSTISDIETLQSHQNRMLNRCLTVIIGLAFFSLGLFCLISGTATLKTVSYILIILG